MNKLEKLVVEYKEKKNESLLEEIITEIRPILFHIIKKYQVEKLHMYEEDVYSEVMMNIEKYIDRYEKNDKNKFTTYLYACFRFKVLKIIKRQACQKRNPGKMSYLEEYTSKGVTYESVIRDDANSEYEIINKYKNEIYFSSLKEVLGSDSKYYAFHLLGHSIDEIAEILKEDKKTVRSKVNYCKRKLKMNESFHNLLLK